MVTVAMCLSVCLKLVTASAQLEYYPLNLYCKNRASLPDKLQMVLDDGKYITEKTLKALRR